MRVLQLSYSKPPRRLAPGGGELGMFQNLCASVDLGHEVHLAVLAPPSDIEADVTSRVASLHWITPQPAAGVMRPLERLLNPETFELRFPHAHGYADAVAKLAHELAPDVIWADSTFALALAPRGDFPVVFGNYDFLYKLKTVRKKTRNRMRLSELRDPRALRRFVRRPDAFTIRSLEKYELRLTVEAAHVMCVSASEAELCRQRGVAATYIPIVGPTIPPPALQVQDRPPRFLLFGNHNTAHAAALAEIRRSLWPALERAGVRCEWHQVGKPPARPDDDWQWMEHTFDRVHGFVDDLGTVFGVGDVSVVPYRDDTGFRTKFTVAAGYGVISAGYDATFLCAPEFSRTRDCIAETDAEGLVRYFQRVIEDREWRRDLGTKARELYEREFTFEAQLPRYATILAAARAAGPLRRRARA